MACCLFHPNCQLTTKSITEGFNASKNLLTTTVYAHRSSVKCVSTCCGGVAISHGRSTVYRAYDSCGRRKAHHCRCLMKKNRASYEEDELSLKKKCVNELFNIKKYKLVQEQKY